MYLFQSGSGVTGNYTWDKGKLEGSLSGLTFTGRWLEAPSYSEPRDAGDVEFIFSDDCTSFKGKWRYASKGNWIEDWNGTRAIPIGKWVLVRTYVNPNNAPTSFFGGGITPGWGRELGNMEIHIVSPTSMSHIESIVRDGRKFFDITLTADFDKPPIELTSGQTITLGARVSGSGKGSDVSDLRIDANEFYYMTLQFQYGSEGVGLDGWNNPLFIRGDSSGPGKSDSKTGVFIVPEPHGGELKISAGLLKCPACIVEWVYRSEVWEEPEWGVTERDGNLYLTSPPGGKLEISRSELPEWARDQLVTVGAMVINVGPPSTIASGDNNVLLNGKPVARIGDFTRDGGVISQGSPRIFINGEPAAFLGGHHISPGVSGGMVPWVGGRIATNGEEIDTERIRERYQDRISQLAVDILRGQQELTIRDDVFEIGDWVIIGNGGTNDESEIARVAGKGSIILDRPIKNSYPAGTWITRVPDEYADILSRPENELVLNPEIISDSKETPTLIAEETNGVPTLYDEDTIETSGINLGTIIIALLALAVAAILVFKKIRK
jgi:uncharacterized Zn-binding protein involved in type VI secretion